MDLAEYSTVVVAEFMPTVVFGKIRAFSLENAQGDCLNLRENHAVCVTFTQTRAGVSGFFLRPCNPIPDIAMSRKVPSADGCGLDYPAANINSQISAGRPIEMRS